MPNKANTQTLIREMQENVAKYGRENTTTYLMVQAINALQQQDRELEAVGAGGVQALSAVDIDGEAFRTAARLGLTLRFYGACAQSSTPGTPSAYVVTHHSDRAEAMREAVKQAADIIARGGEAPPATLAPPAQPAAPQAAPADEAMRKDAGRWRSVEAMVSEVHGGDEFMVIELSARAKPEQHLKTLLMDKVAALAAQKGTP